MNFKGISYYLSLFCFPISILSFINILYSSYFDYFLNVDTYSITLTFSLVAGLVFLSIGYAASKKIDFYEQIILVISVYIISSIFISIPYYFSNYQLTLLNSLFESFSGVTGTGFTIFENVKYIDPTILLWRSSSQWIGGLYFLIFLVLIFSNKQFNYKLNYLTSTNYRSNNSENNIINKVINVFFMYLLMTSLIYIMLILSDVRLYNSLNLTMTLVSNGGFLPANDLGQIIKNSFQELVLIISLTLSMLNIYFVYNLINKKNILKEHYEDFTQLFLVIFLMVILFILFKDFNFFNTTINILSSLANSGLTLGVSQENFNLFFLFLTVVGGSLISNSSGIKLLRLYILIKTTSIEMLKLVKPNNIISQNILNSFYKLNNENIKISFLIFISFFISLFILSTILLGDSLNFENSFKLSVLTLTNTASSALFGTEDINYNDLLASSKISIIFFMIVGKIELISIFLVIKRFIFKN